MKVKAGRRMTALHWKGVAYPVDEDGYCEIPERIAIQAGFVRKEDGTPKKSVEPEIVIEPMGEQGTKAALIEQAIERGIAAPSTLQRWSVERLKREVSEAGE